jgi:hypothetical protein
MPLAFSANFDEALSDKRLDCSLGGFARVSRETAKRASITLGWGHLGDMANLTLQ